MTGPPRLCLVPRWGGGPDDAWYPWLRRQLHLPVRFVPLSPSPSAPTVGESVASLRAAAGTAPEPLARTVLVGHSVGAQVCLRFLETLPPAVRVAGVLAVAAWWWVDEPWPAIRPWTETAIDHARVRAAAPRLRVIASRDDPFTSDQTRSARRFAEDLGAEVRLLDAGGHLSRAREPAVLEALADLLP